MRGKKVESAVMFADISDSTRLYDALGDTKAQAIVSQYLTRMTKICQYDHGKLIKTVGDEIMCRFPTCDEAVLAAQRINQAIENESLFGGVAIAVRIGIHFGAVVEMDGDLYGDVVNVAARMTSIARGKQIITTKAVVDNLSKFLANGARLYDVAMVKGKQENMKMFEILWGQEDVTGIISQAELIKHPAFSFLKLLYCNAEYVMKPTDAVMFIGRGNQCDIVVDTMLVSRTHARLEYRRGKFVLIDQSTNGTFVKIQDGAEVYLRREELPLSGEGVISLGESVELRSKNMIRFHCK